MKKIYEKPYVEVIVFNDEDVIACSGEYSFGERGETVETVEIIF